MRFAFSSCRHGKKNGRAGRSTVKKTLDFYHKRLMLILISYDLEDDRGRTRLAKLLQDFGPRVQKSVFEADVQPKEFERLCAKFAKVQLGQHPALSALRRMRPESADLGHRAGDQRCEILFGLNGSTVKLSTTLQH